LDAAKLAASGIQLAAETEAHYLFTRDNCIALVERSEGTIGSTGVLTEHGLAYLVRREGQPLLKSKTSELPATQEQVAAIEAFSKDLAEALL